VLEEHRERLEVLSDRAAGVVLGERGHEAGNVGGGEFADTTAAEDAADSRKLEAVPGLRRLRDVDAARQPPLASFGDRRHLRLVGQQRARGHAA
jgi:hypothetical protein